MNERDIGVSVGDQASLTMQVTQQHIDDFAGLCGDSHPMHRDPDYAAKTRFGKPVAHGVTPLALVSAVLGTQVGGPDVTVVQLGQTARFLQPVYPGDTITARCEVTSLNEERRIAILDCSCINQDGDQVMTGETTVMLDPMPFEKSRPS